MYYIEKTDKPRGIDKIFKIIKMEENKILIPVEKIEELKEKQIINLANKTHKKLQRTYSQKIILDKKLFENEIYKKLLYSYQYDIVDGKWLEEAISYKILDYIVKQKQIKKEETQISVLVNYLTDYALENIKILAKEYKTLNIVTNHIDKFRKTIDKIYEEEGLMITLTNNKKKSLSKSKIILNIDFPQELVNKYNIYEEAIILSISKSIKINKKRFNGLIVNDYEINIDKNVIHNYVGDSEKYFLKHLYEAEFYKKIPFFNFQKKIQDDKLEIKALYGINGKI